MSIFSRLFGEKKNTAEVAKERLQLIIARQHSGPDNRSPEFLQTMKAELLQVISKYVPVDPKDIKVNLDRQDNMEVLEVNITLPEQDNTAVSSPEISNAP